MKKKLQTIAMCFLFAIGITVVLYYSSGRLLDRLENVAYDWRYRLKYQEDDNAGNPVNAGKVDDQYPDYGIHIVDIDERSMEKMGSYWSWDRGYQAKMVDSLSSHFPAAIAFDVLFYEREDDKRYKRLARTLDDAVVGDSVLNKYREKLQDRLASSVDYDERFASAIARSGRVTLGLSLAEESNYRDFASQVARRMDMAWHNSLNPSSAIELPDSLLAKIRSVKTIIDGIYPENARAAKRIGHVNVVDASSVVRTIPLFYRFAKFPPVYLPMSVRVAADLFATPNEEIVFNPGEYIDIGKPFKIFKDAEGKVSFSYPDFTEAQFRIIMADRDGILSIREGQKRRVSSYVAIYRDDSGGVGIETRGGKASPKMSKALSLMLTANNVNTNIINANNVDTNDINTNTAKINPLKMAVDEETDISGGFKIRRDSDIEWEVFSDDESLWLSALDIGTLASLKPSDLDFYSSSAIDKKRKLVTFDFWVKRENGVLVSSLPVLRARTLEELLASGGADAVLGSIPNGTRRDFGDPARVPLRGNGSRHVVTYFGPASKPFPCFSFYDVMENKVNYPMEGNVFIVGSTSPAMFDIKSAPHERVFPAVEIHASILNSIFTGVYVRRLTERQDILVMAAVALFAAFMGFFAKPVWGAVLTAASLFVYSFAAFHLFDTSLLWIEMVRPLITIVITFTAVTVYRYVIEEGDRRFLKSTFKHYLSHDLIDKMCEDKKKPVLGGETGNITAYFTDIEGFSTISEQLGKPQRLVVLLNEYLTAMTDILLNCEGTLDKYEGDAIIAFFGAPRRLDNHAELACRAALEMQEKLRELRGDWHDRPKKKEDGKKWTEIVRNVWRRDPPKEKEDDEKWPEIVCNMRMRIGINTGDITTGNMGSKVRMNYTMIGDAVNLAARLESGAKQYGVYTMISDNTLNAAAGKGSGQKVGDLFETRKLDVMAVKGKSEPTTVYELLGLKGKLTEDMRLMLEVYNKGVERYYAKDFKTALTWFEKSSEMEPNRETDKDKPPRLTPSTRFMEMCKKYIENPPGDGWDGVNRLGEK